MTETVKKDFVVDSGLLTSPGVSMSWSLSKDSTGMSELNLEIKYDKIPKNDLLAIVEIAKDKTKKELSWHNNDLKVDDWKNANKIFDTFVTDLKTQILNMKEDVPAIDFSGTYLASIKFSEHQMLSSKEVEDYTDKYLRTFAYFLAHTMSEYYTYYTKSLKRS